MKDIRTTFEELIRKIVKIVPSRSRSMHITTGTYQETSTRSYEQKKLGFWSSTMAPQKALRVSTQSSCNKTGLIGCLNFFSVTKMKSYKL